jgi:hypothetical protein
LKIKRKFELDVDFIGGQDSLTIEEEKALSDFFRQRKLVTAKRGALRKRAGATKRVKLKA